MISSGVFQLKKHNIFFSKILLCFFTITIIFLMGCQSAPVRNVVDPLSLLSDNKAYYCSIPSDFDDGIYDAIVSEFASDIVISQKNIDLIKKYISTFYICSDSTHDLNSLDVIISGDFPAGYIKKSFSKDNRFLRTSYTSNELNNKYTIFTFKTFNFCILSNNLAFISSNVDSILKRYEKNLYQLEYIDEEAECNINPNVYEFLSDHENSIKLYASTNIIISNFLKNLGNIKIDFPNFSIYQSITNNDADCINYDCVITAEFESSKFAKTTKSILNFISPFPDDVIISNKDNKIFIENLKIEKQKLFDSFNLGFNTNSKNN